MSLLDFFRRKPVDIDGIEHPVFGFITLESGKDGAYWMHDAADDDELAVSIETLGDAPPTEPQSEFYERITRDQDAAFALASPLLIPRYEEFFGRPFPTRWHLALRLAGIGIPLLGVETNPWDISFSCLTDNTGHIFTCYFIDGQPSHVSLDT